MGQETNFTNGNFANTMEQKISLVSTLPAVYHMGNCGMLISVVPRHENASATRTTIYF